MGSAASEVASEAPIPKGVRQGVEESSDSAVFVPLGRVVRVDPVRAFDGAHGGIHELAVDVLLDARDGEIRRAPGDVVLESAVPRVPPALARAPLVSFVALAFVSVAGRRGPGRGPGRGSESVVAGVEVVVGAHPIPGVEVVGGVRAPRRPTRNVCGRRRSPCARAPGRRDLTRASRWCRRCRTATAPRRAPTRCTRTSPSVSCRTACRACARGTPPWAIQPWPGTTVTSRVGGSSRRVASRDKSAKAKSVSDQRPAAVSGRCDDRAVIDRASHNLRARAGMGRKNDSFGFPL